MNKKILNRFIHILGEKGQGRWIIIGGSVLPFLEASSRYTKDIDLAGPSTSTQNDTLLLMKIAQSLGLPIEAINQAGAFFLYKIPEWEKEIILIHKGPSATIYRPSAMLYLLLKLERLSETDLEDCMKMIEFSKEHPDEPINKKRMIKIIRTYIKKSENNAKKERLRKILSVLS